MLLIDHTFNAKLSININHNNFIFLLRIISTFNIIVFIFGCLFFLFDKYTLPQFLSEPNIIYFTPNMRFIFYLTFFLLTSQHILLRHFFVSLLDFQTILSTRLPASDHILLTRSPSSHLTYTSRLFRNHSPITVRSLSAQISAISTKAARPLKNYLLPNSRALIARVLAIFSSLAAHSLPIFCQVVEQILSLTTTDF